jgi:hypothetical protein
LSKASDAFDTWIRSRFVDLNTELKTLYFEQSDRANVDGFGDIIKARLRDKRVAANCPGINSRHSDLLRLSDAVITPTRP